MKKLILLLTITFILLLSCAVNETTGIIKVENRTHIGLTNNVKIGETLIAGYVAPGGYVNYYYYSEISGKLTTEGIAVDEQYDGENFKLKLNYWVYITADYNQSSSEEVVTIGTVEHNSK